jgi:hypothetical protein
LALERPERGYGGFWAWVVIWRNIGVLGGKTMPEVKTWGGIRKGAGRPKGIKESAPRKPKRQNPDSPQKPTRKQRPQMRAYDDEWALIKAFERIVKKGDRQAAEEFIKNNKFE